MQIKQSSGSGDHMSGADLQLIRFLLLENSGGGGMGVWGFFLVGFDSCTVHVHVPNLKKKKYVCMYPSFRSWCKVSLARNSGGKEIKKERKEKKKKNRRIQVAK